MRTIDEYFAQVHQLLQGVAEAHAERYEEQVLSTTRGNLCIRLQFSDQSLLEISEAIVLMGEEPHWLSYRYHYQSPRTGLIFRYDNAPHRPEIWRPKIRPNSLSSSFAFLCPDLKLRPLGGKFHSSDFYLFPAFVYPSPRNRLGPFINR